MLRGKKTALIRKCWIWKLCAGQWLVRPVTSPASHVTVPRQSSKQRLISQQKDLKLLDYSRMMC